MTDTATLKRVDNQIWIIHKKINHIETQMGVILNRVDEIERRTLLIEYEMRGAIMNNFKERGG